MALLAAKKQKMEIVGTWEHEKERIAEKDHQHEREKEANTLAKIQLKIKLVWAQAQASNNTNFNSSGNLHDGRFGGSGDAVAGVDMQYGLPDVNFGGLNGDYLT